MENKDTQFSQFGLSTADILIPKKQYNLEKWAVVACDQYTSEPEYWKSVEEFVKDAPSTLRIIYPECYLEDHKEERIAAINRTMEDYVKKDIFDCYKDCFILAERTVGNVQRYGLMAALDLDAYSYAADSKTLIRATEGTILSRIPPRKEIRKNAPLEVPHIMVLIEDAKKTIIEPLIAKKDKLEKIYDTPLMMEGGHLKGYLIDSLEDKKSIYAGFKALYNALDSANPLLFAMGDGNHSLATAKSCWEDIKPTLSEDEAKTHPARFALVELENIYSPALEFEPIHRVLFNTDMKDFLTFLGNECDGYSLDKMPDKEELSFEINHAKKHEQRFGLVQGNDLYLVTITGQKAAITARTLQSVIDPMVEQGKAKIDYIHGEDVTIKLGSEDGNLGLIMPDVPKDTFFSSVMRDRSFPRKTFSIGRANEKRFYMEARKIQK